MKTEFVCGIHVASFNANGNPKWFLKRNENIIGIVHLDGLTLEYTNVNYPLSVSDMMEICVLMNQIKKQYNKSYAYTTNP